ncbi:MAG: hypothetical protein WC073_13560 [Sterolibacterium sp.]
MSTLLKEASVDAAFVDFITRYGLPEPRSTLSKSLWKDPNDAIHLLDWAVRRGTSISASSETVFVETIATIRDLIVTCTFFRPKNGKAIVIGGKTDDGLKRTRGRRATGKSLSAQMPWYLKFSDKNYCELCDRPTAQYQARKRLNSLNEQPDALRVLFESERYCRAHDPELEHAAYKKASRRRLAFYSLMRIRIEYTKLFGEQRRSHEQVRSDAFNVAAGLRPRDLRMAVEAVARYFDTDGEEQEQIDLLAFVHQRYFAAINCRSSDLI